MGRASANVRRVSCDAMNDLETLAVRRFGKLTEAEKMLLYAALRGETAEFGPNIDPVKANDWSNERTIQSGLIRWLCTDQEARNRVDSRGVRVIAAKLTGKLDLSYATIPFPLSLENCALADDANFTGAKIVDLCLNGSHTRCLLAEEAEVRGNLLLQKGFFSDGEVRLIAAHISGTLNCEGSTFTNSDGCSDLREENKKG